MKIRNLIALLAVAMTLFFSAAVYGDSGHRDISNVDNMIPQVKVVLGGHRRHHKKHYRRPVRRSHKRIYHG